MTEPGATRCNDRRETAMNRSQREDELRTMLTTQRGKEELLEVLKKHAGIESGNLPPFGSLLVETILNYEYPPESEPKTVSSNRRVEPSQATAEPGDAKFSEPPGAESPGG
jgi:hypothetical protein